MVLCASRVLEDAREKELLLEDTQDLAQRRRAPPVFSAVAAACHTKFGIRTPHFAFACLAQFAKVLKPLTSENLNQLTDFGSSLRPLPNAFLVPRVLDISGAGTPSPSGFSSVFFNKQVLLWIVGGKGF